MTEFEDWIRSHGIRPKGPVVPDGRVHRCPTEAKPRSDNGAWWLALDSSHGWCQDWATMPEPVHWKPGREDRRDDFDVRKLRQAQEAANRKRRNKRRSAVLEAREFWESCRPVRGGHPYLKDHGLGMQGAGGLRVDRDGWLVVPGVRRHRLMTVQRIAPDGTKRFWKDAPAKGVSWMIGRSTAAVTILCEGVATGLALFAAAPMARVLVAFNTAGLTEPDVLRCIPRGVVVVAADNDHRTVCPQHREEGLSVPLDPREGVPDWCRCNPGVGAALTASQALGCGLAVPEGIDGTDWCDARVEWMAEAKRTNLDDYKTTAILQQEVDARVRMAVMREAKLRVYADAGPSR